MGAVLLGTGLNCTRLLNYTKPNLHKGKKLHEGTKLHEDDFAPRVNFARVTFLQESNKIQTNEIIIKRKKVAN